MQVIKITQQCIIFSWSIETITIDIIIANYERIIQIMTTIAINVYLCTHIVFWATTCTQKFSMNFIDLNNKVYFWFSGNLDVNLNNLILK